MIRAVITPGKLVLQGHAHCGTRGTDIVCAAVSILTETLARSLPEGWARLAQGFAEFCYPEEPPEVSFVLRGLRLLETNFPEAVQVTPSARMDEGCR